MTDTTNLSPRPEDGGTRSAATQGSVPNPNYRSTLLLGSDHTELGEIAIETISPTIAIGISRGRFPKGYAHVDPNEDAIFAATDGTTTVLAVADGHHGFNAARESILTMVAQAPSVIDDDLEVVVDALSAAAIESLARVIPGLDPPRDTSRTALTICIVRDHFMATTTIGDTACFIATKRRVKRIGESTPFLGPDTDPGSIRVAVVEVPAKTTIFVASDGFTDFAGSVDRTLRDAGKQPSKDAAGTLLTAAFNGGAGDNIAVGVVRLSS